MRRLLLLVPLGIVLLGIATGYSARINGTDDVGEAKKEILNLEDGLVKALQTSSAATADFYDRILTEDASITISDGSVLTKAEHIAKFRSGEKQLRSVHREDTRVHIYSNTAVVTFIGDTTYFKRKDNRTRLRNQTTDVWVKLDGVWRLIVHAVTPLPINSHVDLGAAGDVLESGGVSESPSDFGGRLDSFVVLTLCQDNRMDKPRQKANQSAVKFPASVPVRNSGHRTVAALG